MLWVCREKCFWRDCLRNPGDTVEVLGSLQWDYSGGVWHPFGVDVVDPKNNELIPRFFEPLDFSVLVDKKLVTLARNGVKVDRKFKYAFELEGPKEETDPEPLSATTLAPKIEPEVFSPSEMRRRGRRKNVQEGD
jgi:hypothetical protein